MKFVGEVLGKVDGIQNFYIVGMLIFIGLFAVILYRTIKMSKQELIEIKTSILEEKEESITNNTNTN